MLASKKLTDYTINWLFVSSTWFLEKSWYNFDFFEKMNECNSIECNSLEAIHKANLSEQV